MEEIIMAAVGGFFAAYLAGMVWMTAKGMKA